MAYVSLYRKYRPQGFDGMIGQRHIVRTLRNTVLSGNVSHAYLFTGTRGTGKTSAAKIFARAINCEHPREDGSPCNECPTCRAMLSPANMDILEIDAASNNGVDEIRDLREKIKFPPTVGKYKVYIIDEVHMLSASAFNALLKTLEEPPAHAVFILATTEVHKIPQTILSRCMRFDFRLVAIDELIGLIAGIFDKEGKSYQNEAVRAIAEAGEGSVRDSLSVADMCVSYCEKEIAYQDVLEVLGACSPEFLTTLAESVIDGDIKGALLTTEKINVLGKSAELLAKDAAKTFRNILFAKNCPGADKILSLPRDLYAKYVYLADCATNDRLLRAIDIFVNLENDLRYSSNPKVVLETAIVKACDSSVGIDTNGVLHRLKEIEGKVRAMGAATGAVEPVNLSAVWGHLLNRLQRNQSLGAAYTYAAGIKPEQLSLEGDVLIITVEREGDASALDYYLKEYRRIICEHCLDIRTIEIKISQKDDIAKQGIDKLQKLFGDDMVKIIK